MATERKKRPDEAGDRPKPKKPGEDGHRARGLPEGDDAGVRPRKAKKRRPEGRADDAPGTDPETLDVSADEVPRKRKARARDVDRAGRTTTGDEAVDKRLEAGVRYEKRKVKDLLPFPLQADYFDDIEGENFKIFADEIARNGLRDAPEILPENSAGYQKDTILRGHQRLRALKRNGKTRVRVLVRYDLAEADALTVEQEFLEDNNNRRQLDQLTQARVARCLFEIMKQRARGLLLSFEVEKAREHVGKVVGLGGKTLQRLWKLLNTPVEVQEAYRSGKLTQVTAARVDNLPKKDQEEIARRIRGGEAAKAVVEAFLPKSEKGHVRLSDAMASYVRSLDRGHDDLAGRVDEVLPGHVRHHVAALRQARRLIKRLLAVAGQ